jgi:hypothetical protein
MLNGSGLVLTDLFIHPTSEDVTAGGAHLQMKGETEKLKGWKTEIEKERKVLKK